MTSGGPLERDAPALPSESSAGATSTADLNPRTLDLVRTIPAI